MTPAKEFRITESGKVFVDSIEVPAPTGIELNIEPFEPVEILLRTFALKIIVESDDESRAQSYPVPDATPCSEFRATTDGRALLDGAALPGVCGYCVDADINGDTELVLRILAERLNVQDFSPLATGQTAESLKKRLSADSDCARPRRRLFSWLPFPRKQLRYQLTQTSHRTHSG